MNKHYGSYNLLWKIEEKNLNNNGIENEQFRKWWNKSDSNKI